MWQGQGGRPRESAPGSSIASSASSDLRRRAARQPPAPSSALTASVEPALTVGEPGGEPGTGAVVLRQPREGGPRDSRLVHGEAERGEPGRRRLPGRSARRGGPPRPTARRPGRTGPRARPGRAAVRAAPARRASPRAPGRRSRAAASRMRRARPLAESALQSRGQILVANSGAGRQTLGSVAKSHSRDNRTKETPKGNERDDHARTRGQAEFRQGRAGDPGARRARPRAARRAHRAALRRADVGRVLRPARAAQAGRQPRGRVRARRPAQTADVLVGMEREFLGQPPVARGRCTGT